MFCSLDALIPQLPEKPVGSPVSVSGGCVHECYRWGDFFIKINQPSYLPCFEAEAIGLSSILATQTLRAPEVITWGNTPDIAYLVLEFLELRRSGNEGQLGEQLAALHQADCHSPDYGFLADNFIGATPQENVREETWAKFFKEQRLKPMFERLASRGVTFPRACRLLERLADALPSNPPVSLLHGDLWGGNCAFLRDGSP
ncbi:MAG: fructosamine kinase family protein, partial [Verrucomicrobiales bacterium]